MMEQRVSTWNRKPKTKERFPLKLSASPRLCVRNRSVAGFSLIEFIGVLSVVAILAALTVPVLIRQIDQAANTREAADLKAISDGLVHQILATRSIPRQANLPQAVATWTRQPVARIAKTPRGHARLLMVDEGGWLVNVPWTQTSDGLTNSPASARLMIVSSISGGLPTTPGNFADIWATADGANPPGWTGRAEDLHIQRINLEPLFHHLVLVNRDPPGSARYAIDSTNTVSLTNVLRRYYLDGTDLGLYDNATPPKAQLRVLLDQDRSFVFQAGRWSGQLDPGDGYSDVVGNEFATLAGQFLAMEWVDTAHKGGNQQGAVISMFDFMLTYQLWANQCPHFPLNGETTRNKVPEYILLLEFAGDATASSCLLNSFTGSDGLLK